MFTEPGAPLVSFVYSDSDVDYDETWKQINTTSFAVDDHLGIMFLSINWYLTLILCRFFFVLFLSRDHSERRNIKKFDKYVTQ